MFLVSICRLGILEPAVELRHLRYFVAVAEMENVSRAALKLHVSQPALSRQIRDLEDEIGFSLLERTAKSVRLTDAGRTFLDNARAFTEATALNRREIDLAGDVRTMPEAAEILTEALGRPIAFAQTPIEQVRQYSKDMAVMLEWFERVGYSADIAGLEREFGRALTKLPDWARRHARPNGQTQGELS